MKINIDKNLVEFKPENADEKAKLEELWRLVIDCAGISKKLVPVGEYVPAKNDKGASFFIEGLDNHTHTYSEIHAEKDCKCYCDICNKLMDLKKGDAIPLCCGKVMEIID